MKSAEENMSREGLHRWQSFHAAAPGLGAALLVAAKCPACWLAYAGLLTVPGLVWLFQATSLTLMTLGVLGIALASLASRASARRGYRPLGLGVMASNLVLIEKFFFSSPVLFTFGIALLAAASLWNA